MSRWWTVAAVVGTLMVSAACGSPPALSPAPGASVGPGAFAERAQLVINAWQRSASETEWKTGFIPLIELVRLGSAGEGSVYRNADGDEELQSNLKRAIGAGAYHLTGSLPTGSTGGKIEFADGSTMSVPLLTAQDAFERLRRGEPDPTCTGRGCRLAVTGARLTNVAMLTSRGSAMVPTWQFTVTELAVPVNSVAVAPTAITPMPEPSIEPANDLIMVDAVTSEVGAIGIDVRELNVHYSTGTCIEEHGALIHESATAVVVGAQAINSGGVCNAMAVFRTSSARLDAPLGTRVLLDAATGKPIVFGNCNLRQVSQC